MCSPERFVNLQSNKSCNLLPSNHCHFSMWIDTVIWLFAACPGIVCPTTFLRGSTALSPDAGDSAGQGKRRCWFVGGFWWFDIGRSISKMIVKTLSTKEGTQMQAVRSFISALHNFQLIRGCRMPVAALVPRQLPRWHAGSLDWLCTKVNR